MDKEELKKELILKHVDIKTLVDKVKRIMKIDESGRPFFLIPENKLTAQERLGLYLTSRFFSKQMDITDINNEWLSLKQLTEISGIKYDITKTRLREMEKQRFVDKSERKDGTFYKINNTGINAITDRVLNKLEKGD